jgi:hypothetical protein
MNEYVNDDVYFLKVMVIPGLSTTYQPGLWNTMVILDIFDKLNFNEINKLNLKTKAIWT